jgi:hypothetical protein
MPGVPKKVVERLSASLRRFQPILAASKARDDGEGDTVMIVTDMLLGLAGLMRKRDDVHRHDTTAGRTDVRR